MDRREFFLKTGLAGVGLNTSTVREAVGSNAALALRRRDPHGKLTLSNDAMDWHFEWHDGKLASLGFYNKLSEHAFKFSASRELALNFSVSDQRVEIPWWKFTISPGVTAVPPEQEPGHEVKLIPVPHSRQFGNTQGMGYSWVVYKVRMNPSWAGKGFEFAVHANLARSVEAKVKCWVVKRWWEENTRPVGDGQYGNGLS